MRFRKDVPDHAAFRFVPLAVETCGYIGKEAVKSVNRLGDIAAESGRIPKVEFVRWAIQLLCLQDAGQHAELLLMRKCSGLKSSNRTCACGTAKVHQCPRMLTREAQDVAGLEVAVHPPAAMQLRQPLRNQTERLHMICHQLRLDLQQLALCTLLGDKTGYFCVAKVLTATRLITARPPFLPTNKTPRQAHLYGTECCTTPPC